LKLLRDIAKVREHVLGLRNIDCYNSSSGNA
jgi:hypothetical protein